MDVHPGSLAHGITSKLYLRGIVEQPVAATNPWTPGPAKGQVWPGTSLDFVRWKEIFGDQALTGTLLDGLTHRCYILEMNGESYRFKESLRRKEKA